MRNKLFLTLFIILEILIFNSVLAYEDGSCTSCGKPMRSEAAYVSVNASQHAYKKECANTSCLRYMKPVFYSYEDHSFQCTNNGLGKTHTISCKWCDYKNTTAHSYGAYKYYSSTYHRSTCGTCGSYYSGTHAGTDATCTSAAYCNTCKSYYGDALGHSTPASYSYNKSQHWKLCERGCGEYLYNLENHYDNNKDGKCDVCGYILDITPPVISFSVTSNSTAAKSHSTVVTVTDEGGSGLSSCKYVWNTSSTSPTAVSSFTTSFSTGATLTTPTGNGTYYLHIYAIDGSGNSSIKSSGGFVVDNTAPTGTIKINNGATYTTSTSVTLTLSASSDVTQMAISNSTTKGTYQTYVTSKSWTLDATEGTKTVYIYFKDTAGNESARASASIILDTSNPTAGTMTLTPSTHSMGAAISGAKDAASGVKNYDYYIGGSLKASNQSTTYTYTGLSPNTQYTIQHTVRDNVDKVSSLSSQFKKYTLAMIPVSVTASSGTSDTSIAVSWSANTNPSGTKYIVEYSTNGSTWTKATETTSTSYTHTGLAKNTVYQYRIKAVNGDGIETNYSGAATGQTTQEVISDSIILDLEAPVATFTENTVNGHEVSLKVNIQESYEIDVLKYVWTTSATKLTAESQFTGGTFTSGTTIYPPDAKGTYYLQVYASDKATNVGIYVSSAFVKIPQITTCSLTINNGDQYTKTTSATLTLSADSAQYMYISESTVAIDSIASSSWEAYATSKAFTLSSVNGTKTVYAYFKDVFGNVLMASDTIFLDSQAPVIGGITGPQVKNTASGGTVSVTASGFTDNNGSGINNCDWYYKIGSGSWSAANAGTISGTSSTFNVPITTAGTYTVRIWLYDKVANGSYVDTTILIDRTPPTIANVSAAQTLSIASGTPVTVSANGFTDAGGAGVDYCTWQYKTGTGSYSTAVKGTITNDSSEYTFNITGDAIYTARITLYDKAGNSSYKETTVQVDHTKPTLGTLGLTATTNSITATVTGASDNVQVGGYEFYIDGVFAAKQTSNVYTYTGLMCSTAYNITYKVYDVFGNYTDMSADKTKYTLANIPENLTATDDYSPTKIEVSWTRNENAPEVQYELVASDDQNTWTKLYEGTEIEYIHKNLALATTKYYKVRAKNQEGVYTEYTAIESGKTIDDITPPTAEIISRENITLGREDFAKDTDSVRMVIKVYDESYASTSLKAQDLAVYINTADNKITSATAQIEKTTNIEDGVEITILLTGIGSDGDIFVYVPAGKFVDKAGNTNEPTYMYSAMVADNTDPTLTVVATPVDPTYDGYYIDIFSEDLNGLSSITLNGVEITLDENGKYRYYTETNDTYTVISKDTIFNESTKATVIDLISLFQNFEANVKIPANVNGAGNGTTLTLPIPSYGVNNYMVIWGDGSYDTYTREEFPTHTYKNTTEQTYLIKVKGDVDTFGYYKTTEPTATNTYSNYYTFTEYLTQILEWGELGATRFGFAHCDNLVGPIPDPTGTGFTKLTSVENMFLNCTSLNGSLSENLLSQATEITSAKGMFKNCSNITGPIPENMFANNPRITTFEDAFNNCKKLTGSIPSTLFEKGTFVESYAGTFNGCSGLTGVIPQELFKNSLKVNTFRETFANCSGLVSPNAVADGTHSALYEDLFVNNKYVLNYYRTFYNCKGLTGTVNEKLFASNAVIREFPEDATVNSNFRGTFEGCTGIQNVDMETLIVGHEMFKGCTALESVKLDKCIDIGNEAFYGCNVLTNIEVGSKYFKTMGTDSFEYTGTNPDKLVTRINKDNEVLAGYAWIDDNRIVDVEAPKGTIEIVTSKYPFTKTQTVDLKITITDNYSTPAKCEMAIINEDKYTDALRTDELTWQTFNSNVTGWTLTPNDGIKTVYVFFKDEFGNVSKIKADIEI